MGTISTWAAIDGVYSAEVDGRPEFHELSPPENEDVLQVTTLIAARVIGMIERCGLEDEAEALSENDPGLRPFTPQRPRPDRRRTQCRKSRRFLRGGLQLAY